MANATSTSVTISDLESETEYAMRVVAHNTHGVGRSSKALTVTTLASGESP